MADWSNAQRGLVSGFQVGQATGGRMSGLGSVIAKVADRLKQQRQMGEEMGQKQNLLGYAGLAEGKIQPAQEGEAGAFNIPGMGRYKSIKNIPDLWDIQKEARTTVNAMINQNPVLQAQAFSNPALVTDLIDKEVERLSGKYRGNQLSTTTSMPVSKQEPKALPKINMPQEEERIIVISSTGQKGTIPKSQLEDALKAGYRRTIK